MPDNLKQLVVVMVIGVAVLWLARPIMLRICSPEDYRRRSLVWAALTIGAFVTPSFWWFVPVAAPLLYWAGRADSHPVALYLLIFQAVPSIFINIPIVGINKLFELDFERLLSLCVLVPAAFRAYRYAARTGATAPFQLQDLLLIGFGALQIVFFVRPDLVGGALQADSATNALRRGFLFFVDAYVIYFAVSRYCASRRALVEALACLGLCVSIAAPIGVFETARHWLLYGSVAQHWSHDPLASLYLMRDNLLRAQAAAGNPLSLGYLLAIGCGIWLYLWHCIESVPRKSLAILGLWLGLLAAYSRGPWIGAVAIYLIYAGAGPRRGSLLFKTAGALSIFGMMLAISPFGQRVIHSLPMFGGSIDSGNYLYRQQLASLSWQLIQQHPLIGDRFAYGKLGALRQGLGIIDVVNTYIEIALFYGLIGVALFVGFMLDGIIKVYRLTRASLDFDPDLASLGAALLACCVGTMLMLADCSFILSYSILYYVLGGFAAAYWRLGMLAYTYPVPQTAAAHEPFYGMESMRRS